MRCRFANNIKVVYFKRWSRKSYAAFASLHLNIIISTLKKGVAEASLYKVEKYVRRGGSFTILFPYMNEKSESPPDTPLIKLPFMFLLSLDRVGQAAVRPLVNGKKRLSGYYIKKTRIFDMDMGLSLHKGGSPFLCINT